MAHKEEDGGSHDEGFASSSSNDSDGAESRDYRVFDLFRFFY
jgi:hypothetical protein